MATDFFDRQAAARRSTAWLIGMFALAVVTTAGAVFLLVFFALASQQDHGVSISQLGAAGDPVLWQVPLGAAVGSLALIGGGSLYKVVALRAGGGRGVAEGLSGRRILHDTATDPSQRQLLNIVDEMAIASGVPAPPVFLIDDRAINAFAAGYSPSDAVIGVTTGCVEALTRDELQGVIAHEFSHILNGDMRMSIRLIGVLHGILLLGLIGRLVIRIVFHTGASYDSRRPGNDGEGTGKGGAGIIAVLGIGVALIVIGAIGSLFGGLIKAAVSRQREYLADASAVQFTRNPEGIAGALKRIMAASSGAQLRHPRAAELSHMYFAQGVWEGFTSLMATHPPLKDRVLAIDPNWDGSLPKPQGQEYTVPLQSSAYLEGAEQVANLAGVAAVAPESVDNAVDRIGDPLEAHRVYAAELISKIPPSVRKAAGEPSQARAVVYALLLDEDPQVRNRQQEVLKENVDPKLVLFLFSQVAPAVDQIDPRLRLPLIDLCLPSLAAMSAPQYQRFIRSFRALVVTDDRLSLFEWTLSQVLLRHLRPHFERVRSPRVHYRSLEPLADDCGALLTVLARSCGDQGHIADAYAAGQGLLTEAPEKMAESAGLDDLRAALERLATAAPACRERLIDAAAAVVCADDHVTVAEAELLRGIADLLDCPMPPLLPGQKTAA